MAKILMTPGPTYIHEDVREALRKQITNPDLDIDFFEFYKSLCSKIGEVLKTDNEIIILSGEGILGLEASIASLVEPSDKVLCIENGIYGYGFGDFVKLFGGKVNYCSSDRREGINIQVLREYLKENHDFKVATVVHCETPSGITNPVKEVVSLLNEYGIISIVDSVSSIGGEELYVDEWGIDVAIGASQKCISAPPGLTFLSLSNRAKEKMYNRKSNIPGFYNNLTIWKDWYEKKWFPYTQPISDLYALDVAIDRVLNNKEFLKIHADIATSLRSTIKEAGLELYPKSFYSNTVTSVVVPEGISFNEIFKSLNNEYNILIGGGFDFLENKIFRIGHMGENCNINNIIITLKALDEIFLSSGIYLKKSLDESFTNNYLRRLAL
ncbi:alanine--glyoxylate aminotransferase family protein [Clostridium gasigenes]|uniref:pyridoxal-phosphate-dependent aminotransferase family protein n=1 Tax=Clostridium gasigenes TaxID=94869 RepID=UPI0014382980|nr:alanine--glyoxylate aminotransferase family protein [Clostridium gasigenes]NKF05609.1 alanine--glyoxylate aminotransferase family protein [Clostridium gasigenes]QSW19049.1 alanine--glyoxylate aminotransferase family protein [Clostridium gasigenes]